MCEQYPVVLDVLAHATAANPVDRLIQCGRVPPAVHVRLAERERAVAEHALVEAVVMDLHVPRLAAADHHARGRERLTHELAGAATVERVEQLGSSGTSLHIVPPSPLDREPCRANAASASARPRTSTRSHERSHGWQSGAIEPCRCSA